MKTRGENNKPLTQALFYEWNNQDAEWSMRDTDQEEYYVARSGKKYKSLPYLFRNSTSEYECAIKFCGSWKHWNLLSKLDWFKTGKIGDIDFGGLEDWKQEKKIAEQALAKKVILEQTKQGNLQAARALREEKGSPRAGRPETKKPKEKKSSVVNLVSNIKKNAN